MIVNFWKKGAYIYGSANELTRLNYKAPPKKRRFFYGFSSLFGKASVCGTGKQGSIPGDTPKCEWSIVNFVSQVNLKLISRAN